MKLFNWIGRDYLVGKSRGLKEGPIDPGRYELPVPDKKKTCKRQNKKSRQHNGNLDKCVVCKWTASAHGRIEVGSTWDTIRRAQCDNRNAGQKNTDDDKQDEIFLMRFINCGQRVDSVPRPFQNAPTTYIFENFFLYYLAAKRFSPRLVPKTLPQLAVVLAILYVPKFAQEWILHYKKFQPWVWFKGRFL